MSNAHLVLQLALEGQALFIERSRPPIVGLIERHGAQGIEYPGRYRSARLARLSTQGQALFQQ